MQENAPTQTYGQRQVGLSFNPAGSAFVNNIKNCAAALIDELNEQRTKAKETGKDGEALAQYTIAIRAAEEASMRGVKAATWQ